MPIDIKVYKRRDGTPDDIVTSENFPAPVHLKYFYCQLQANNMIISEKNDASTHIWTKEVLKSIK
jgi:hypothetical protein